MRIDMSRYSTLAIAGMIAALLGACGRGASEVVSMSGDDFMRVAASIARQEDRITADQLARWIAEGTRDFVIVDVRPESEFDAGHIKGSLNISLPMLVADEGRRRISASQTVVVYSNGSENAAKAAVMLRLVGIQASFLLGGYNHWGRYILNPKEGADQVDGELLTYTERRALACSFCELEGVAAGYRPPVQAVETTPRDVHQAPSPARKQSNKKARKAIASEGC